MRISLLTALTLVLAGLFASTASAGFGCSSSAGRVTVLGKSIEPVAVAPVGDCSAASESLSGAAIGLPSPLSADVFAATTQVFSAQKTVLASGGLANLGIASPSLPIDLAKVPAELKAAVQKAIDDISLDQVREAIPKQTLKPLLSTTETILGPLGLPILDTATNEANAVLNQAIVAENATKQALNDLRASIADPAMLADSVLAALLAQAKLPTLDILKIRAAGAYASGSCVDGAVKLNGSSTLAGVTVLGEELSVDGALALTRTLTDTLDPAKIEIPSTLLGITGEQGKLITGAALAELNKALATANSQLDTALANLGKIEIPLGVADIRIAPGQQVKTADAVTQQALTVAVSVAGQKLIDAVIGEARVSAADVDCALPVTDPKTSTGATLGCSTRKLVLVDVLERKGRVKLFGVADPALAGQTVSIVFNATGRKVATAKVDDDGTFDTTAPLPPVSIRDTNAARYMATLGEEESINLKLRRRMVVHSMKAKKGKVTIVGRVLPPLGKPRQAITLTRRVSCTEEKVVTRFKPRASGRFRVTVRAPKGAGTAVYRMTTKVRNSATGTGMFETYTLPRAVDLKN